MKMKKKSPPRSELSNDFLTVIDSLLSANPTKTDQDLVNIFNKMDDDSKTYVLNYEDGLGNSLLLEAAAYPKESTAITLVNLGFNINHYNVNGKSVLINAVKNKLYDLIDLLLEKGVDVNYARTKQLFEGWPHPDPVKVGSSAIMFAAEDGEYEIVKKLVEHGADINYVNDLGQYPLLYCIKKTEGHFKTFKYLIEQPNIIAGRFDKLGNGVLERIIKFGTMNFLSLALEHGLHDYHVCSIVRDQAVRNVGFAPNNKSEKNSQEQALEMINYAAKYIEAKELSNQLGSKKQPVSKKMKI